MTHTRNEIRTLVRTRLGDADSPYHWSDQQINQWINDAIADYSNYFPRRQVTAITTLAADRVYDLPEGCRSVILVEFPTGDDPPSYLTRRPSDDHSFYYGEYYDVLYHNQAGYPPELILGQEPESGAEITVTYDGVHAWLDDDYDTCTLIDEHLEAIMLYVRWAAFQELASTESADPDPESMAVSILELNAYRAERAYRNTIRDYLAMSSQSGIARWTMDQYDRIY